MVVYVRKFRKILTSQCSGGDGDVKSERTQASGSADKKRRLEAEDAFGGGESDSSDEGGKLP